MGRFIVLPAAALDDERMTPATFLVLAALSTYADKTGWCWPHQETMAKQLGVNQPAVSKHMGRLEEFGYIERHRSRAGTRYLLLFDRHIPRGNVEHSTMESETFRDGIQKETTEGNVSPEGDTSGPKRSRAVALPADWQVTPELQEWAATKCPRVDLAQETERWRRHHEARGSLFVKWNAAWQTWMLRAIKDYANVEPFPHAQAGRRGRAPVESDDDRRARLTRVANRRLADKAARSAGED